MSHINILLCFFFPVFSNTGDIKILEINEDGKFIRLFNTSSTNDIEVGGYMIQQNIGGHPVAVYRFAPRTRFRAGSTITVSQETAPI